MYVQQDLANDDADEAAAAAPAVAADDDEHSPASPELYNRTHMANTDLSGILRSTGRRQGSAVLDLPIELLHFAIQNFRIYV